MADLYDIIFAMLAFGGKGGGTAVALTASLTSNGIIGSIGTAAREDI